MKESDVSLQELKRLIPLAETEGELARLERQLLALQTADRDTARQKATLQMLTQQAAAGLVGISSKHLRDEGAARNLDGTYNGPDLVQWLVDRQIQKAEQEWRRNSDSLKSATERQAEAKAIKLEEEAKGVQGAFIKRSEVRLDFMEMAASVRTELEALPRLMANDFPAELREGLVRELKNYCNQILRRLAAKGSRLDE